MLIRLAVFGLLLATTMLLGYVVEFYRTWARHHDLLLRGRESMHALVDAKAPVGTSQYEWEQVTEFTMNAYANCFFHDERMNWPAFEVFVRELERRAHEPVTLELIKWIWDEIESIGIDGTQYAEKYRFKKGESRAVQRP